MWSEPQDVLSLGRYPGPVACAVDRVTRLGATVLVVCAALTAVLTTLAANGFALRHACVPRAGVLGLLSSDFALVRQPPGCPAATTELGASPGAMVTVIAVLALPVVFAQLAALTLIVTASAFARRVVRHVVVLVAAVFGAVLALIPRCPDVVSTRRPWPRRPWWQVRARRDRHPAGPRGVRGPPIGVCAVV